MTTSFSVRLHTHSPQMGLLLHLAFFRTDLLFRLSDKCTLPCRHGLLLACVLGLVPETIKFIAQW